MTAALGWISKAYQLSEKRYTGKVVANFGFLCPLAMSMCLIMGYAYLRTPFTSILGGLAPLLSAYLWYRMEDPTIVGEGGEHHSFWA